MQDRPGEHYGRLLAAAGALAGLILAFSWLAIRPAVASPGPPAGGTPSPTPTSTAACVGQWQIEPSPNNGSANTLNGVSGIASNDVWAVGGTGTTYRTVIEHWDGATWSLVSSFDPGFANVLYGVTALASNDVWAAGWYEGSLMGVLVKHWDGTQWTTSNAPNGPGYYNTLLGISGDASNDVWAVGYTTTSSPTVNHPLILHWNGGGWTVATNPDVPGGVLRGVSARAADDVWAVGTVNSQTLTMHWDGTAWSVVPSPNRQVNSVLQSVASIATDDAWAVGYSTSPNQTLIMHWDGTAWSIVSSPNSGTSGNQLNSVSARDGALWAVGTQVNAGVNGTLAMRWSGSGWDVTSTPTQGAGSVLSGVAVISASDVRAVGNWLSGSTQTLVERYSTSVCSTFTPTGTAVPTGTATTTPTATCIKPYWTYPATIPVPVMEEAVGVVSNKLYTSGGHSNGNTVSTGFAYDAAANTWTAIAQQPQARHGSSGVVLNGMFYVLNGADTNDSPTNTINVYDPATNSWSLGGNTLVATWGQAAVLLNNNIYRIAGCISADCTTTTGTVERNGQLIASYPNSTGWLMATALNGYIYAAGGTTGLGGPGSVKTYRYDPNTDTWDDSAIADLPYTLWGAASGIVNGNWVLAGGFSSGSLTNITTRWDPNTNSWSYLQNIFLSRAQMGSGAVANALYAVGGSAFVGGTMGSYDNQKLNPGNCGTAGSTPTAIPTIAATPSPTECSIDYTYEVSSGAIVQGSDVLPGSQCGRCVVPLELPFPFTFYGQAYSTINVATYGTIQFTTVDTSSNSCPLPYPQLGPTIMPDWDDWIDTGQTTICLAQFGRPCGVYTSVSGSAPNRIVNIEWVGRRVGSNHYFVNVEARLYESTGAFDFVYGVMTPPGFNGYTSTIGIQDGAGSSRSYACQVNGSIWQGLLLRWTPVLCGPTPTPSPIPATSTVPPVLSPTATGTPAGTGTPRPTDTAIATATNEPTATGEPIATATATACPIQFTDVPPGSTFYDYVRCLACRGIISGYPDGTFRPNVNVTRGQLAKIVSGAAGWSDPVPSSQQTFEDILPGSIFWLYIERLYGHGAIGGYPCGQRTDEPCVPPTNRPYFREGANATRGQVSKIVSTAAGYSDDPGAQRFQDVPADSPFFVWINRLVIHTVISGYPCGGQGEPCLPPQNLPYFRPNASVTRGQLSKMASITFFPGCSVLAPRSTK